VAAKASGANSIPGTSPDRLRLQRLNFSWFRQNRRQRHKPIAEKPVA
jgi:hypothetical protein